MDDQIMCPYHNHPYKYNYAAGSLIIAKLCEQCLQLEPEIVLEEQFVEAQNAKNEERILRNQNTFMMIREHLQRQCRINRSSSLSILQWAERDFIRIEGQIKFIEGNVQRLDKQQQIQETQRFQNETKIKLEQNLRALHRLQNFYYNKCLDLLNTME